MVREALVEAREKCRKVGGRKGERKRKKEIEEEGKKGEKEEGRSKEGGERQEKGGARSKDQTHHGEELDIGLRG